MRNRRWFRVTAWLVAAVSLAAIVAAPASGAPTANWSQILRKMQGVSGVYAGYKNGPADIPGATPAANTNNLVGSMSVPKGNFTAFAKLTVENSITSGPRFIECRLEADGDSDTSAASVPPSSQQTIALNVAHTFPSGGTFEVRCTDSTGATTDTRFYNLKITAIEVPLLSNNQI